MTARLGPPPAAHRPESAGPLVTAVAVLAIAVVNWFLWELVPASLVREKWTAGYRARVCDAFGPAPGDHTARYLRSGGGVR